MIIVKQGEEQEDTGKEKTCEYAFCIFQQFGTLHLIRIFF
jgi:hypothetical protein